MKDPVLTFSSSMFFQKLPKELVVVTRAGEKLYVVGLDVRRLMESKLAVEMLR